MASTKQYEPKHETYAVYYRGVPAALTTNPTHLKSVLSISPDRREEIDKHQPLLPVQASNFSLATWTQSYSSSHTRSATETKDGNPQSDKSLILESRAHNPGDKLSRDASISRAHRPWPQGLSTVSETRSSLTTFLLEMLFSTCGGAYPISLRLSTPPPCPLRLRPPLRFTQGTHLSRLLTF